MKQSQLVKMVAADGAAVSLYIRPDIDDKLIIAISKILGKKFENKRSMSDWLDEHIPNWREIAV